MIYNKIKKFKKAYCAFINLAPRKSIGTMSGVIRRVVTANKARKHSTLVTD